MYIVDWDDKALEDKKFWQKRNPKVVKRIEQLVEDIQKNPFAGLGKPEALRHESAGEWSRRIDKEHRLRYVCNGKSISIIRCRGHYTP